MLDLTAGPVSGDPYWAPPQQRPFLQEVGADPGSLRIAYSIHSTPEEVIHPDCRQAVEETARLLESLGHVVEEATPELTIESEAMTQAFTTVWQAGCASTIDMIMQVAGIAAQSDFFEPLTWFLYEGGRKVTASEYLRAITLIQRLTREIAAFHQKYDVMLTSVLAQPPVPIRDLRCPGGRRSCGGLGIVLRLLHPLLLCRTQPVNRPCRFPCSGTRTGFPSVPILSVGSVTKPPFFDWQRNLKRQSPGPTDDP